MNVPAMGIAVDKRLHLMRMVMGINQYLLDALQSQVIQPYPQKRLSVNGDQAFWDRIRIGFEPCSFSSRQ